MNLWKICFSIFVYVGSIRICHSFSSSSLEAEEVEFRPIREYERRPHPSDEYQNHHSRYEYNSGGNDEVNGLHDVNKMTTGTDQSRSNVQDYEIFDDVVDVESYREPRSGHQHIPTEPQQPAYEQNEKKVNGREVKSPSASPLLPPPPSSHQQLETHINYNTVPGTPGVDYPSHSYVPLTTFYCYNHQHPGYYADVEAGCQVFHVCDVDGRQDSFLCPKGTIFNQAYFICDWWFNVDCGQAPNYYGANGDLHKEQSTSASSSDIEVSSYSDAAEI